MKPNMTKSTYLAALFLGMLGGVYFGLFSCGGYVWHKQAFLTVFFGALLLVTALPPYSAKRIGARVLVVLGIVTVFAVTEATAACFYPDSPASWTQFRGEFVYHLENGPG
jgi:hypothetical protein